MYNTRRRTTLFLAALMSLTLLLAACGTKAPAPAPAPVAPAPSTPAPATAPSGEITLYTSESQEQVNEMKADFEAANPGIKLNIFRSGSGEVIAKLNQELQANQVVADLIWFADYAYFDSIKDKLLAYDTSASTLPAHFKYQGGKFYEVRQIYNVVAYNTNVIKTPPTGWADLKNPAYQGKVAMASPLYSGAAFSTMGTLVKDPAFSWNFYESLKANGVKVEQGNGAVNNKLATGEYVIVSVVGFMVRNAKTAGSPVDYVWPVEGAVLIPTPIGIMASSKNPAAAQAFINYQLTERGQKLFLKQGYMPVIAGIGNPPNTPDMSKLKIAPTDYDYIEANRELLKTEYARIFPQ